VDGSARLAAFAKLELAPGNLVGAKGRSLVRGRRVKDEGASGWTPTARRAPTFLTLDDAVSAVPEDHLAPLGTRCWLVGEVAEQRVRIR
jgi:hypothetical protein